MWAIGFFNGYNAMGNDGAQVIHNKSKRGIFNETQQLQRHNEVVYIVPHYTQQMCEMNNDQLYSYCSTHSVMTIKKGMIVK